MLLALPHQKNFGRGVKNAFSLLLCEDCPILACKNSAKSKTSAACCSGNCFDRFKHFFSDIAHTINPRLLKV